jgi:hypothetical protein
VVVITALVAALVVEEVAGILTTVLFQLFQVTFMSLR